MNLRPLLFYSVLLFMAAVWLGLAGGARHLPLWPLFLLAFLLPASALLFNRYQRCLYYSGLLLIFLAAGLWTGGRGGEMAADSIYKEVGKTGAVTGKVVAGSWRERSGGYASFLLECAHFTHGDSALPVSGRLRVTLRGTPEKEFLPAGALVGVAGEIRPLTGFFNPGGYDWPARERRRDIYGRLAAEYQDVAFSGQVKEDWRTAAEKFLAYVRAEMLKRMSREDQAVISGMLFGGYNEVPPEVVRDFSATGIVHILSVSGTHVAVMGGAIFRLAGKMRFNRRKAAIAAMAGIMIYSALAGFAVPVVRAALLGLAILAGEAAGRRAHTESILGAALVVMLMIEPRWLPDISFQLSFAAAAGIVFLYRPLKERLERLPDWLGASLALTLAVQIAALPFLAGYFYQVPVVAFLSNIIILPLAQVCLLVALAGVAVSLVIPAAGGLFYIAASLLLGLLLRVNSALAEFGAAALSVPALPIWLWVCYYIIVLTAFGFTPFKLTGRARVAAIAGVLGISLSAALFTGRKEGFSAHFIDVGQGDACLFITPGKKAVLIDAGSRGPDGWPDAGETVIAPYLRYLGVKGLDLLIISHGHNDHAGGAAAVARLAPVREVWLPGGETGDDIDRLLHHSRGKSRITRMREGQVAEVDGLRLEVLKAPDAAAPGQWREENSAVVKGVFAGKTFLFTGDADKEGELSLVPQLSKINVLKVSHHGAATSSEPLFIGAIDPDIAVISAGAGNRYGHPADVTLETLRGQGSGVLRTDELGAVVIRIKEERLVWYGYKEHPDAF